MFSTHMLDVIRNLWLMRKMNRRRFNQFIDEADIYGEEEAKEMTFEGRLCIFRHQGRKVALAECERDIIEVFFREAYSQMDVRGKRVADVGCGAGDTATYFILHGAAAVNGYDSDEARVRAAKLNTMNETVFIEQREVKDLDVDGDVLKMDIEGGEHAIFARASDKEIQKFGQIIMEFHDGYADLKERLERAGYSVSVGNFTFGGRNGILYGRRVK